MEQYKWTRETLGMEQLLVVDNQVQVVIIVIFSLLGTETTAAELAAGTIECMLR